MAIRALLAKLGYVNQNGAYRHPQRSALFVGDFIDRGPRQLESVMTVRRMIDAGTAQAVLGNHEFNAIAWHTHLTQRLRASFYGHTMVNVERKTESNTVRS